MPLPPPLWRAAAGSSSSSLPRLNSSVYYFPLGHSLLQSSSFPPFSLCRLTSLHLLSHPLSDEPFASLRLLPLQTNQQLEERRRVVDKEIGGYGENQETQSNDDDDDEEEEEEEEEFVSFAKILTPSDANNGGGFSVPRFCADSIFPPLDFSADPPVQTISLTDLHGTPWEFRHIYRGTPRRHLLTTGWSRFVNAKKLVAGDSVVFIKSRRRMGGQMYVGIRRNGRWGKVGRVGPEEVEEAVREMGKGKEFEVRYFPRAGWPEFVVEKERVERAMAVEWREGMRVSMAVEMDDSPRVTWFQGTVAGVEREGAPWRMLKVNWDEPEVLQNVRAVSPWQVELVSPQMQAPFPAMKKLRFPHCIELSTEGQGHVLFSQPVTGSTKVGNLTSLFNYENFPAGMQGARHDFGVPSLSSFVPRNTHHLLSSNFYGIDMPLELNTSQSESTSPPSQDSIHNSSMELLGGAAYVPARKVKKGSFQLFGQIIHMEQPDNDIANDIADKEYADKSVMSLEFSPPSSHKRLLDDLAVQHQRIQPIETCIL